MAKETKRTLPDVALNGSSSVLAKIDRVGMSDIDIPIVLELNGSQYRSPGKAAAFISLDDPSTKGIHMSRLFSRLQELADKPLNSADLERIVKSFQASHHEVAQSSELRLSFDINLKKTSLISNMTGWRHYPVKIVLTYENGAVRWLLKFEVVYSSTCPCSAALSRQLIQEKFLGDFSHKDSIGLKEMADWLSKEDSQCATPHSQRSFARVEIAFKQSPTDVVQAFLSLIEMTEGKLKTPVQSFVKRSDEQEFARLNAENLMFCEDAARRIHELLASSEEVASYVIEVEHQESLHPHNAVARVWSK